MHQSVEADLGRLINTRIGSQFEWGVCDCNTLALEALDLIAGTQLAVEVFGMYSNPKEASDFYRNYRLDWATWDGFEKVGKNFVQTGDFVIAKESDWCIPYIVVGDRAVSCFETHGVRACRLDVVLRTHKNALCVRPSCKGVE